MPWTFVRPLDRSLLLPRPMLDLGCGDGQTALALHAPDAIGIDRSDGALRAARASGLTRVARADGSRLPFADSTFAVVLAADLLHHVEDLPELFDELRRVIRPDGVFVAWWYETNPHPAPDAPRFPRAFDDVVRHVTFGTTKPLDIETVLPGGPPTTGMVVRV